MIKIPFKNWLVAFTSLCALNTPSQAQTVANSSLLWKIEKNGNPHVSYLFGTIHMIPANQYFVPTGLKDALKVSEALVLEMDIDIPLREQMELMATMVYPTGKSLQDFVEPADFELFKTYCLQNLQISESKFQRYIRLKPTALSAVLLKEALGKTKAFEKELSKMAKKHKQPIIGLETLKEQASFLDSIEVDAEKEFVKDTTMLTSYYAMVELYKQQDLNGLYKMMINSEAENESFERILLISRNLNWIEKLDDMLLQQNLFVAVGAGHLPSENGLIELLRQKGFTVSPVIQ